MLISDCSFLSCLEELLITYFEKLKMKETLYVWVDVV